MRETFLSKRADGLIGMSSDTSLSYRKTRRQHAENQGVCFHSYFRMAERYSDGMKYAMRNLADLVLHRKVEIVLLLCSATLSAQKLSEPSSRLTDLQGQPHTIAELRGKPTVLNFWATWCMPCKAEMPRLDKLQAQYAPAGVQFIAISIDDTESRSKIPSLIAKRGFHIPVWQGASSGTLKELELGELVPATVILDAAGIIVGRIEGEASEKDIRSRLDWLLNGRQGKQPKLVQKNDW
jgi:thiol-disulfide isomerase/thioredoxin